MAGFGFEAGAPFTGFGATAVQMFGENSFRRESHRRGRRRQPTGPHACEKVARLRIKLGHQKAQKASRKRIAKTKAKLKKAKADCRAGQVACG